MKKTMSKPELIRRRWDKCGSYLIYGPLGIRHIGDVNVSLAFAWNVRICRSDVKGEVQVLKHKASVPKRSTETERRCSRSESSVTEEDRRTRVIQRDKVRQPVTG